MNTVLLIGNYFQYGQSNPNVWHALAAHLSEKGWRVITTSRKRNKFLRLMDMLLTIYRERDNYDVAEVDIFSGPSFIWAEFCVSLLNLLKKRTVITLHGGKLAAFEKENPKRVRRLFHRAKMVVTPSLFLKNHFSKIREDIVRIPNGIDLDNFKYYLREKPAPKLIWLRALHQIYSPWMAVEVLNILRNKFQEISLTMVGPDKGDGSLEKVRMLVDQYRFEDSVRIIGGVDKSQVPYWLNQGDIFINTTRYESFGVSVLEAAVCGLPIVTTDAGELPYMWEDGVDALVVPVDDPAAMAEAVGRILTEPELAVRLSANARKKAEAFDWSILLPQWEKLYSELIENRYE